MHWYALTQYCGQFSTCFALPVAVVENLKRFYFMKMTGMTLVCLLYAIRPELGSISQEINCESVFVNDSFVFV